MSYRQTWGSIRNQVGQAVGLAGNHPNLKDLYNEAGNLAWAEADYVGKHQKWKIRVTGDCQGNACLTYPHAIETIEKVNICNTPIGVRTLFFEFLNNAVGEIGSRGNGLGGGWGGGAYSLLGDQQEVCTIQELVPGSKKLRIYTERIEDSGRILLLGYDDNGAWIRTFQDNCWMDGEYLNLADSPATTNSTFASITGVQFDKNPRNGGTYLYSVDPDNVERQLAIYDYSTQIPVFRRSILSGVPRRIKNADGSFTHQSECVTILAKMRFIPVIFDTDYAQIGNVSAMKSLIQYIYKRDSDKIQDAQAYKDEGFKLLDNELKQFDGYGAKKMIDMGNRQICSTARNLY